MSENLHTLLQLCGQAARKLPPVGDLFAEGAVVLDQTHDVTTVAIGPYPMARHKTGGGRGQAVPRAAAP